MALIAKDLMSGNPKLAEQGFGEEALGHNAIAAGFQGQRHWTDWRANGDFMETMANSSYDWDGIRQPYVFATENDTLNGISMLFGHLLTNTAQIFSDVRTYWSPEAVERVTGHKLSGQASGGLIHLINSGSTCLDGTGEQSIDGKPAIKPFWDISSDEAEACVKATEFCPADSGIFQGRRILHGLSHQGRHARHHESPQSDQRPGPRPADCRRLDRGNSRGRA
jgi:L-fucose isomerase